MLGTLIFLVFFIYFYKTSSGKFRQSILCAFASLIILGSIPQAAHAGADDFREPDQQHQISPENKETFSDPSNNDASGPVKPNADSSAGDDGVEEVTNSDSKAEEDESQVDCKAGFKELPDGKNFSYNMDQGPSLKKQAKKVWKNPIAKKEVLRMLNRFDDENANMQEKPLKGFKNLTELKNSRNGPRIIIHRGKNKQPTVISFCMRKELNATVATLKEKYN